MYDVFLSYGHEDVQRATSVWERLTDTGLRVWMDDPGREVDVTELGVPAGTRHREVIYEAIADSGAFLILDGPVWRSSEYCRDELDLARELGRRVVCVGSGEPLPGALVPDLHKRDDELSEVADELDSSASFGSSQVRLDSMQPAWAPLGSRVPVWRRLARTPGHQEASALLADVRFAELLTDWQRKTIAQVLKAESDRLRWLRRAMSVWTAAVLVAAITSGIALGAAKRSQSEAELGAARADSQRWASAALAESFTGPALLDAQRSVAAFSSETSREALRLTEAAAAREETWPVPAASDYTALAFAPDGRELAATTRSALLIVDAGGQISTYPLDGLGSGAVVRWVEQDRLWILSEDSLREFAVRDRGLGVLRVLDGVVAFDVTPDGEVFAGLRDGSLARLDAESQWQEFAQAPSIATALLATNDSVYVSTRSLTTQRYLREGSSPRLAWSVDLGAAPVKEADGGEPVRPFSEAITRSLYPRYSRSDTSRDELTQCGGDLLFLLNKGSAGSAMVRLSAEGTLDDKLHKKSYVRGVVCWKGVGIGAGTLFSSVWSETQYIVPTVVDSNDRFAATVLAVSHDGKRLAAVSTVGELRIVGQHAPAEGQLGTLVSLAPMPNGGWLVQDFYGALHRFDGESLTPYEGKESYPFTALTASGATVLRTQDDRLLRVTDEGLVPLYALEGDFADGSWALSADAATLAAADPGGIVQIFSMDDGKVEASLRPTELAAGERLADVAVEGGLLYAITSSGRVVALDIATGATKATASVGVVGSPSIVFRPGPAGGVAVSSRSGQLLLLDADLSVVASRRVTTRGVLHASELGGVVVWESTRTLILGPDTLDVRNVISFDGFDFLSRLLVSSDGAEVALWEPVWQGTSSVEGDGATLIAVHREKGIDPAIAKALHAGTVLEIPLTR